MATILLVGTATLDIVYTLKHYPREDEEMRAEGLRVCRGGNAANTAVVLSRHGHACMFSGVLAKAPETAVITEDFVHHEIDFSAAQYSPGRPPTSSIYLSGAGRTIVHHRDLPELEFDHFVTTDLAMFDWIHFEGRNVPELLKMLRHVRETCPDLPISLEVEKPRAGIEGVLAYPVLLVCSRAYAESKGFDDPAPFLQTMSELAPQANVVVGWGEAGAYGLGKGGVECHSPAFPPKKVVDTLGAGDTFNAGLIHAMLMESGLSESLRIACDFAGRKCGVNGFNF